jgi:hypothetical protein
MDETVKSTLLETEKILRSNGFDGLTPRDALIIGMVMKVCIVITGECVEGASDSIIELLGDKLHEACWRKL